MNHKRQVFVAVDYRGALSLGDNRARLGYAAYHWGIVILPKVSTGRDCNTYDVSDGVRPDPESRIDLNPRREWFFRSNANMNPALSGHLLGLVMIGKVPNEVTYTEIQHHLKSVPLPCKDAVPGQNCVSWVISAVKTLQRTGLAETFDLGDFMTYATGFADQRMSSPGKTSEVVNYTSRPMARKFIVPR